MNMSKIHMLIFTIKCPPLICSLLVLLYSNQVEWCRIYNAKIIQCGKDLVEAKELATRKAEEEGLQYVNG